MTQRKRAGVTCDIWHVLSLIRYFFGVYVSFTLRLLCISALVPCFSARLLCAHFVSTACAVCNLGVSSARCAFSVYLCCVYFAHVVRSLRVLNGFALSFLCF